MSQVSLTGTPGEVFDELWRPRPKPPVAPPLPSGCLASLGRLLRPRPAPSPRVPPRVYLLDSHRVDNDRLKVIQDFLQGLRPDLEDHSMLQVDVDFRSTQLEEFRTEIQEKGPRTRARYRQEWLKIKAVLCDGNKLHLSVTRSIKQKLKRKARKFKNHLILVDCIRLRIGSPASSSTFPPPVLDLRLKGLAPNGDLVLLTPLASFREVKGYQVQDTRDRLVRGEQLLAACILCAAARAT